MANAADVVKSPAKYASLSSRYLIVFQTAPQEFEYKTLNQAINLLARSGWRVVNIVPYHAPLGFNIMYALMERASGEPSRESTRPDTARAADSSTPSAEMSGVSTAPVAPSQMPQPASSKDPLSDSERSLSDDDAALLDLIKMGRKIHAIMVRREATGEGLKEAKDYVDSLESRCGLNPKPSSSQPVKSAVVDSPLPLARAYLESHNLATRLKLEISKSDHDSFLEVRKTEARTFAWWAAFIFGTACCIVPGLVVLILWRPEQSECALSFAECGSGSQVSARIVGWGPAGEGYFREVSKLLQAVGEGTSSRKDM